MEKDKAVKKKEEKRKRVAPKSSGTTAAKSHKAPMPDTGHFVNKASQSLKVEEATVSNETLVAKTPLGKRLLEIRARAIASGMKLLTEEELDKELAERRGGIG